MRAALSQALALEACLANLHLTHADCRTCHVAAAHSERGELQTLHQAPAVVATCVLVWRPQNVACVCII